MSQKVPTLEMKDGNSIPQIGLGTYRLKGKECQNAAEIALENGYNHIDTAEMYENETEVGKAIRKINRGDLFTTSKVWPNNLHYEDVLNACESSLNRLGTPYLDLYLIHWPNEAIPLDETLDAMKELHDEGKVKSIGVSNFTIRQVKEAMEHSDIPIAVNQIEFHPWLYQKKMLDFCSDNDIILTAYSPLARTKIFEEEIIQNLADKYDKSRAQIVLRWGVQKGVVVIPRSSSRDHIKKNIQIFDWELSQKDIERIDSISTKKRLVTLHYADF